MPRRSATSYRDNPAPEGKAVLRASEGWKVEKVPFKAASAFVSEHHYTRSAGKGIVVAHGLYDPEGVLQGVAWWNVPIRPAAVSASKFVPGALMLANEAAIARGQKPPYKRTDYHAEPKDVINLSRLVIAPGMPQNAATFLMAASMRLLDRARFPVLLTFADTGQGHTGAIYKATNWIETGRTATKTGDMWVHRQTGEQRGRKRGPKTLSWAEMRAAGFDPKKAEPKIRFVQIDTNQLHRKYPKDTPQP